MSAPIWKKRQTTCSDKVSHAARNLPVDIDARRGNQGRCQQYPIITVSVQSTTMNALELSDYAEISCQEKLQTIRA